MSFTWLQTADTVWVLEGPSDVYGCVHLVVLTALPGDTPPGCCWEWVVAEEQDCVQSRTCLTRAEAMRAVQTEVLPPVILLALVGKEDGLLPLRRQT